MNRVLGPFQRSIGVLLLLLACVSVAHADGPSYPRVGQIVSSVGNFSEAQKDSLAFYDLVCFNQPPAIVEEIRGRNPDIELLWIWMPQFIVDWSEDETFWHADTTWSLARLAQLYALENDWFLYDTDGERIGLWNSWIANWTEDCPVGTYGTSVGMTYAEWLAEVAIPTYVNGNEDWEAWGPGSSSYQGLHFEVMSDCFGSFGWQLFVDADTDRDGTPDGVYSGCCSGGDQDPLSVKMREVNEWFGPALFDAVPDDMTMIINGTNQCINPSWQTQFNGIKIEGWYSYPPFPVWQDWWDFFYNLHDYGGTEDWEMGYRWAESNLHRTGEDDRDGWDQSWVQLTIKNWSPTEFERRRRFGLGTSMLGNGYFMASTAQEVPEWQPEYDWDFGRPVEDYWVDTFAGESGPDSLYVRRFDEGMVEVNPNEALVHGILAESARFSWWSPVEDLVAESAGGAAVRVTYSAPSNTDVTGQELRYSTSPIDVDNWDDATVWPEALAPAPGAHVTVLVHSLQPNRTYYFAIKNHVHDWESAQLSNVDNALTGSDVPDSEAPASIDDVSVLLVGEHEATVRWTATGDDGDTGQAAVYAVRKRPGGAILNESDWNEADPIGDAIPAPAAAGTDEELTITGLASGTVQAVAIRAIDEHGNMGPLSNPFTVLTDGSPPPQIDNTPPAGIDDLAVVWVDSVSVELEWTAVGDDGEGGGSATAYEIRALEGRALVTKTDWNGSFLPATEMPEPGLPGTTERFVFDGLEPGTLYGFAVRAIDDGGLIATSWNSPTETTLESDDDPDDPPPPPPPDDPIPPETVDDLFIAGIDTTAVLLRWTAPDDGEEDAVVAYEIAILAGDSLHVPNGWDDALIVPGPAQPERPGTIESFWVSDLDPGTLHGFAIRSVDTDTLWSEISDPAHATTLGVEDDPPPPPADTTPPGTVDDLVTTEVGLDSATLSWTASGDDGGSGTASRLVLYFGLPGAAPDSLEFDDPLPGGSTESRTVDGLEQGTAYEAFVVVEDEAGNRSEPSNLAAFETETPPPPPEDTTPPETVDDLAAADVEANEARIFWTAAGDDGATGQASSVVVYYGPIGADPDSVVYADPAAGGESESRVLSPLLASTNYQAWVITEDDAGNRSDSSNLVTFATGDEPPPPPPHDSYPPSPISVESVDVKGPDAATVGWYAVGDDLDLGLPSAYWVAVLENALIEEQADWSAAQKHPVPTPFPTAGEWMERAIEGLSADTMYGVAVRAVDEAGNWSEIVPGSEFRTDVDPESYPPKAILDLHATAILSNTVAVSWTAPADSVTLAAVSGYRLGLLADGAIEDESDWNAAKISVVSGASEPGESESFEWTNLSPNRTYGLSVRAVDDAGRLGPLSNAVVIVTSDVVEDDPDGGDDPDDGGDGGDDGDDGGDDPDDGGDGGDDGGDDPDDGGDGGDDGGDDPDDGDDGGDDPDGGDDGGDDPDDGDYGGDDGGDDPDDGGDGGDDGGDNGGDDPDDGDDGGDDPDGGDDGGDDPDDGDDGGDDPDGGDDGGDDPDDGDDSGDDPDDGDDGGDDPDDGDDSGNDPDDGDDGGDDPDDGDDGGDDPDGGDDGGDDPDDGDGGDDPDGGDDDIAPGTPASVSDLHVAAEGADWIELSWTAVATEGNVGRVLRYELRWSTSPIRTESDWAQATPWDGDLPDPGKRGKAETLLIQSVDRTKGFAAQIRAIGSAGQQSNLGEGLWLDPFDQTVPEAPHPPTWTWNGDAVVVEWTPSTDVRVVGHHIYRETSEATWVRESDEPVNDTKFSFDASDLSDVRRVGLTLVIVGGQESPLATAAGNIAESWQVEGPFPHPIHDQARFRITPPSGSVSGNLRVEILDLQGRRLQRLYEGPVLSGEEWTWYRDNEKGEMVGPGFYFLRAVGPGLDLTRRIYVSP